MTTYTGYCWPLTFDALALDYLESQLKYSIGDYPGAIQIAKKGLERAEKLGAKEDQRRLNALLQEALSKNETVHR